MGCEHTGKERALFSLPHGADVVDTIYLTKIIQDLSECTMPEATETNKKYSRFMHYRPHTWVELTIEMHNNK